MARKYATTSIETTLSATISSSATSFTVASAANLLGNVSVTSGDQFAVAIDPDTISEEIVFVTAVNTGTNLLTVTRGQAGTSQITHTAGAKVKHVLTGEDMTYFENIATNALTATSSATVSNKAISLGSNTVTGTTAQFNTALTDGDFATLAGTETLTGKSISLGSNTVTGTTAQFNTALTDGDFATIAGTETLSGKSISLGSNTVTGTTAQFNTALTDADFATLTGTEVLTNKILLTPEERATVSATAATGTVNFDAVTQAVLYYTSNASANFTLNFRGNSGTTLSSLLAVGDTITLVFLNTCGATAYYPSTIQIDGSSVTPKWQGGTAPTAGNASSIDAYSFTIIKTASTPTYTVLASQVKFA